MGRIVPDRTESHVGRTDRPATPSAGESPARQEHHDRATECRDAIRALESAAPCLTQGLPEELFLFLSRMTPLVNVDLLIQDPVQGLLLTWREDEYDGPGWHVPGGIIRFKETVAHRIREVARLELGVEVEFEQNPAAIHEYSHPTRATRGHFISLLYRCRLTTPPDERLRHVSDRPLPGQWRWHSGWPPDLIEVQQHYRQFVL